MLRFLVLARLGPYQAYSRALWEVFDAVLDSVAATEAAQT